MAKPTDAELMTGFNPQFQTTAEEIEAQQDGAAPSAADPEGEGETLTEAETAPAADEREVTLDGRTFKAPREVADAFTREINRRDGTRGAELHQLRERLARLEGATTTAPQAQETRVEGPPLPDPELQIENPAEYQRQLVAHIAHQQEQRTQALAQQYEEAEAMKEREASRRSAWQQHVDSFYSRPENGILAKNRDIVDLVLEQNRDRLAPLSVEDGFKELERLAKDRIAQLTGQAPEARARSTPRPPTLEGSSRRASATGVSAPVSDGPRSLTQALKERRRAAAEAFKKGGQPRGGAAQR